MNKRTFYVEKVNPRIYKYYGILNGAVEAENTRTEPSTWEERGAYEGSLDSRKMEVFELFLKGT